MTTDIKLWKKQHSGCFYWLGVPQKWLQYFKEEDFKWIVEVHKSWLHGAHGRSGEGSDVDYRYMARAGDKKRAFKKVLRARRNKSFTSGMYLVRTSNAWFTAVAGKYNHDDGYWTHSWQTRPKKGDIITWIQTDELGRQIFMHKNRVWAISGCYLDGISKVSEI